MFSNLEKKNVFNNRTLLSLSLFLITVFCSQEWFIIKKELYDSLNTNNYQITWNICLQSCHYQNKNKVLIKLMHLWTTWKANNNNVSICFSAHFWCRIPRRDYKCVNSMSSDWSVFPCTQDFSLFIFRRRRADNWQQFARVFSKSFSQSALHER